MLYVGDSLAASVCEVFGESEDAPICPYWRVALLRPTHRLRLLNLVAAGVAMSIGALPALENADLPRTLTQQWARAIYEDNPLGVQADGIRYKSGYNGGNAHVIWDAAGKIRVVKDEKGLDADEPLGGLDMLERLKVELMDRQIVVRRVSPHDCSECRKVAA